MVTLQILVLSFLVRIQVAQLKRLSFEGRFFCCYVVCMRWRAATAVMLFVCRCKHCAMLKHRITAALINETNIYTYEKRPHLG